MFTNTEDVSFNETNESLFRLEYKLQWEGFVDAAMIERAAKEIKEGEFAETKELEDYLHKFKVNK